MGRLSCWLWLLRDLRRLRLLFRCRRLRERRRLREGGEEDEEEEEEEEDEAVEEQLLEFPPLPAVFDLDGLLPLSAASSLFFFRLDFTTPWLSPRERRRTPDLRVFCEVPMALRLPTGTLSSATAAPLPPLALSPPLATSGNLLAARSGASGL